ncbi:ferritin [Geotalea toluenoxydans]|uniref:ferritin n=1 Tax=Geotalea toluenoxydans TaxID=421624 RepID=UPI0006D1D7F2|nr:ferritin [Geotalea toluenoxydans]
MLNKKMYAALNKHMNIELYSAYLYLSMSSHANSIGLKGAANWFMVQYQEEMVHFMKFYNYINSQGASIGLSAMSAPPGQYKSLLDMFEQTLKHEQFITRCINDLTDLALKEKDHASHIFLQWFVTEQIEEEENDRDLIGKLRLIGDNGHGLLMLDGEMAARVFVPPPATAA